MLIIKKRKLIIIYSLAITFCLMTSFIFIHTDPIRVSKSYNFWHGYLGHTLKETPELEYTSENKRNVRVRLIYEDNSITGMGVYKSKSGLWFIIPNSVYSW